MSDFHLNYDGVIAGGDNEETMIDIAGPANTNYTAAADNIQYNINKYNEKLFFGYLDFSQDDTTQEFFRYNKANYYENISDADNPSYNLYPNDPLLTEVFPFSLLDGEGGIGGAIGHNLFNSDEDIPNLSSLPRFIYPKSATAPQAAGGEILNARHPYIFVAGPEFTGTIKSDLLKSRVDSVNDIFGTSVLSPSNEFLNSWSFDSARRSFIPLMQGSSLKKTFTYRGGKCWFSNYPSSS